MIEYPIPQRIHRDDRAIVVTWDAEHESRFPARWLRLRCHCAVCRDEMSGRPLIAPDSVADDVRPLSVQLVGSYAIRITWSDGHDTGIYTYRYLRQICFCERCRAQPENGGR